MANTKKKTQTSIMQLKIAPELKKDFYDYCQKTGRVPSLAVKAYMQQCVEVFKVMK